MPIGWSLGHSRNSDIFGSLTVARIFRQTNSDAVSLNHLLSSKSVNEYKKLDAARLGPFSPRRRLTRSSSAASSADFTGSSYPAIPNGV